MFHSTFFPTPPELAKRLVEPYDFTNAYVLEPSAGKGDLLKAIEKHARGEQRWGYGDYLPCKLYAIELIPDLRAILEGENNYYTVIHDDFLTYHPRRQYTHIIMNPPFDQAEAHLQHAWEILYSGEIAAIMPATAFEGKTVQERMLIRLVEDHGTKEEAGQPFIHAERPTDVRCVIVRLTKKPEQGETLEFETHNDQMGDWTDVHGDGRVKEVGLQGFVESLLAHHTASLHHFEAYNLARQKLLPYVAPFQTHGENGDPLKTADGLKDPRSRWNAFYEGITENAWNQIYDHPGLQQLLTERARRMMDEYRRRQKRVDFNERNIRAMLEAIIARRDELLMAAVLDAFDTLTRYHAENRVHFEGWKNVKAWKVNPRKVVLPACRNSWSSELEIDWGYRNTLTDVDRALCVVSGKPFNDIVTIAEAGDKRHQHYPGAKFYSTFFELKMYKKGTLHLRFLDEQLAEQFNLMAARGRGWLPPGQ